MKSFLLSNSYWIYWALDSRTLQAYLFAYIQFLIFSRKTHSDSINMESNKHANKNGV
jgi:hypothetical protein